MTRLSDFWKFLATNLLTKVAENDWAILNRSIQVKTAVDIILANFGNIYATFFSNIWSHWASADAEIRTIKFVHKSIESNFQL